MEQSEKNGLGNVNAANKLPTTVEAVENKRRVATHEASRRRSSVSVRYVVLTVFVMGMLFAAPMISRVETVSVGKGAHTASTHTPHALACNDSDSGGLVATTDVPLPSSVAKENSGTRGKSGGNDAGTATRPTAAGGHRAADSVNELRPMLNLFQQVRHHVNCTLLVETLAELAQDELEQQRVHPGSGVAQPPYVVLRMLFTGDSWAGRQTRATIFDVNICLLEAAAAAAQNATTSLPRFVALTNTTNWCWLRPQTLREKNEEIASVFFSMVVPSKTNVMVGEAIAVHLHFVWYKLYYLAEVPNQLQTMLVPKDPSEVDSLRRGASSAQSAATTPPVEALLNGNTTEVNALVAHRYVSRTMTFCHHESEEATYFSHLVNERQRESGSFHGRYAAVFLCAGLWDCVLPDRRYDGTDYSKLNWTDGAPKPTATINRLHDAFRRRLEASFVTPTRELLRKLTTGVSRARTLVVGLPATPYCDSERFVLVTNLTAQQKEKDTYRYTRGQRCEGLVLPSAAIVHSALRGALNHTAVLIPATSADERECSPSSEVAAQVVAAAGAPDAAVRVVDYTVYEKSRVANPESPGPHCTTSDGVHFDSIDHSNEQHQYCNELLENAYWRALRRSTSGLCRLS